MMGYIKWMIVFTLSPNICIFLFVSIHEAGIYVVWSLWKETMISVQKCLGP